jgi:iron(III) transport system permease protein
MLLFVFALLWLERRGRRGQAFHATGKREAPPSPTPLRGPAALGATLACASPVLLGFMLPGGILLHYAVTRFAAAATPAYAQAALNTLSIAGAATLAAVLAGLFLAYANRLSRSALTQFATRLAGLGYAVPGTVLGIGLLVPLAALDNRLNALAQSLFGVTTGLVLTGSIFAVGCGYLVRFLAISHGTLDTGLERVTPNLRAAARTLGRPPLAALLEVDLPLLRPALVSAALLVFVDCMKELPATLILRPFNFETLATHVYTLASLAQLEESALAALTIVATGILPVILLSRSLDRAVRPAGP